MQQITKKITSFNVVKTTDIPIAADTLEPIQKEKVKLTRGDTLHGATYKIKPNLYTHGLYITINNTYIDGVCLPYEIFITTKNTELFPLTRLLSLTITSMFRWQQDITHLLDEYLDIPELTGGYWGKTKNEHGKPTYYKSVLGEISDVIRRHLGTIALTNTTDAYKDGYEIGTVLTEAEEEMVFDYPASATICPSCSVRAVVLMDGCGVCLSCSYSKCS